MADNTKPRPIWLNRFPILDEDHAPALEAAAAVFEFKHKMPRQGAEEAAHAQYMKERALEAAAHHHCGIKAAHASGHDDAAAQHGEAYVAAMKAAGHDPYQAPPQELLDLLRKQPPKLYNFKAHAADSFFSTPEAEENVDPADARIKELLERLQALKSQAEKPE